MQPAKRIEEMISIILTTGIIISCLLTLTGGVIFLWQHAHDDMHIQFLQSNIYYPISFKQTLVGVGNFSANAIIALGLFALVMTQIARVGLLVWFYVDQRDDKFILISLLIFFLLIYSVIWHK